MVMMVMTVIASIGNNIDVCIAMGIAMDNAMNISMGIATGTGKGINNYTLCIYVCMNEHIKI